MSNNAHERAAQEQHFADIFARLHEQDIEQFYAHYQLWVLRRRLPLLEKQIEALREHLEENRRTVEMMQPSALALAVLVRLQSNGVNDTNVLDQMLDRGEDWLDRMMQRLDYCEQVEDFIQGDYTQWCIRSLEGAYDWIDSLLGSIKENEQPLKTSGGETIATEEQLLQKLSQDDEQPAILSASASEELAETPADSAATEVPEPVEVLEPIEPAETAETPESLAESEVAAEMIGWRDLEDLEAPEAQPVPWYSVEVDADGASSAASAQAEPMDDWIKFLQGTGEAPEEATVSESEQPTLATPEAASELAEATVLSEAGELQPVELEVTDAAPASEFEGADESPVVEPETIDEPQAVEPEGADEVNAAAPVSEEASLEVDSAVREETLILEASVQESAALLIESTSLESASETEAAAPAEEEIILEHEPALSAPAEEEIGLEESGDLAEEQVSLAEVADASEVTEEVETGEGESEMALVADEEATGVENAEIAEAEESAAEVVPVEEPVSEAQLELPAEPAPAAAETQAGEVEEREETAEGETEELQKIQGSVAQEPQEGGEGEAEDLEKTLELRLKPQTDQPAAASVNEIENAAIVNDILGEEDEQEEQLAWYEYLDLEELASAAEKGVEEQAPGAVADKKAEEPAADEARPAEFYEYAIAEEVASPLPEAEAAEMTEIEGWQSWKGSLADEETVQLPLSEIHSPANEAAEHMSEQAEMLAPVIVNSELTDTGMAWEEASLLESEAAPTPSATWEESGVPAPQTPAAPVLEAPPQKISFWRRLFGFGRKKKR